MCVGLGLLVARFDLLGPKCSDVSRYDSGDRRHGHGTQCVPMLYFVRFAFVIVTPKMRGLADYLLSLE